MTEIDELESFRRAEGINYPKSYHDLRGVGGFKIMKNSSRR